MQHFSQKHAHNFVLLPYQPENNDIPVRTPPAGFDALRTLAVSRNYRDNFDHIHGLRDGPGPETGPRGRPVGDQGLARGCFPLIARLQAA